MPATIAANKEAHRAADDARQRLLQAGLRLFAHQGYTKTSTRELAEAAQVNIAAISYYFGDKAGLYRAVFFEPLDNAERDVERYSTTRLNLADALRGFFAGFLEPLKHGDATRLCMKLHVREMLEPTGLWQEEVKHGIQPLHEALLVVLCRHLHVGAPDADVQRLALCLAGLGVQLHLCRDVNDQLAPGLHEGAKALQSWSDTLVRFGVAMVRAEARRRRAFALKPAGSGTLPKPAGARPVKPARHGGGAAAMLKPARASRARKT